LTESVDYKRERARTHNRDSARKESGHRQRQRQKSTYTLAISCGMVDGDPVASGTAEVEDADINSSVLVVEVRREQVTGASATGHIYWRAHENKFADGSDATLAARVPVAPSKSRVRSPVHPINGRFDGYLRPKGWLNSITTQSRWGIDPSVCNAAPSSLTLSTQRTIIFGTIRDCIGLAPATSSSTSPKYLAHSLNHRHKIKIEEQRLGQGVALLLAQSSYYYYYFIFDRRRAVLRQDNRTCKC
jgi:hypothetical protein